jgi:hypothetical protein
MNSFQLSDTQWHRVTLPPVVDMARPCVIKTGRTWIPKKSGVGEDARTLGVAVAGLTRADRLE